LIRSQRTQVISNKKSSLVNAFEVEVAYFGKTSALGLLQIGLTEVPAQSNFFGLLFLCFKENPLQEEFAVF
jgi:hypothetical protein